MNQEQKREATRERVKKHRALQKSVTSEPESVTSSGVEGVTSSKALHQNVTDNMIPIVTTLGDIKKRAKLRQICQELQNHNVMKEVRYGVSGPTMDIVSELLEAF